MQPANAERAAKALDRILIHCLGVNTCATPRAVVRANIERVLATNHGSRRVSEIADALEQLHFKITNKQIRRT